MREKIITRLAEIEAEHQVSIFWAIESGSRAWGFDSTDSDFDVRFIYAHPPQWYLSIEPGRDVIEYPMDGLLDISGWDLKKALRLLKKSNPPLLEWLGSPIVYQEKFRVAAWMREAVSSIYSPRSCMHHYLNMAAGDIRNHLQGETVRLKKYFYALRPILCCLWIESRPGPPAVEFSVLVDQMVEDSELKDAIMALIALKKSSEELDRGIPIPIISEFLRRELDRLRATTSSVHSPAQTDDCLDLLFRQALVEIWGPKAFGALAG